MITKLAISGYRSLRDIVLALWAGKRGHGPEWLEQVEPLSRAQTSGRDCAGSGRNNHLE